MKIITSVFTILLFCFLFIGGSNAQDKGNSNKTEAKNEKQDQPVQIKNKPHASIGNCSQTSGIVTIKVTFDKSAKITNVEIATSSGCDSFDKNAVKAAKGIKFKPAIKNGETITIIKQLQYSFRKF